MIGMGMSGAFIPLLSTVARWFVSRRSMVTGIVLTGTGIGALIAPPVANQFISNYDWRASYLILGSFVLVFVILFAQLLKRDPATIGQVPYGQSKEVQNLSTLDSTGLSLREAIYTRQCWMVFGMVFCLGFCLFAIMVHLVPHATDLGISDASAANILATIGGSMIVGRIVMGSIADKIGNRQVYIIGFSILPIALLWLALAMDTWMLYLFAVVFGFAHAGTEASTSPLIAKLFGLRSHSSIFGVIGLGFCIGSALAPLVTGYIFDLSNSYQVAFFICAGIGIIGLVLTILLKPMPQNKK
jgi:MFS family permease